MANRVENFPPKNGVDAAFCAVKFFDIFDYALRIEDFLPYMCGFAETDEEVRKILEALVKDGRVGEQDGLYFLLGRENLIQKRKKMDEVSVRLWRRVRKFGPLLHAVPFVKGVAVCNTLAFGSATDESDIDLFIITARDRIFTARVLSALLYGALGVRRHSDKVAGRFCLSFYVSEDGMDLAEMRRGAERDVYLWYWMRSLRPLFGEKVFVEFFGKNGWIGSGAGSHMLRPPMFYANTGGLARVGSLQQRLLRRRLGNFIEQKLERLHVSRHRKREDDLGPGSSVMVGRTMLKYHNIDRRDEFNSLFWENFGL